MLTLSVEGMTCAHCERAVRAAVQSVHGVDAVQVDVTKGTVRVQGSVDAALVRTAIEEEGYKVKQPLPTAANTSPLS